MFLWKLHMISIRSNEDRMSWKETKLGKFFVISLYASVAKQEKESFLAKVSFFEWGMTWGGILMLDQLKWRWWILPNRCYICKDNDDSIDHLLHHSKVSMLQRLVYSLFTWYDWQTVQLEGIWVGMTHLWGRIRGKFGRLLPCDSLDIEDPSMTSNIWIQQLNLILCLFFFFFGIKVYIEDHSMSIIGFIDWLSFK